MPKAVDPNNVRSSRNPTYRSYKMMIRRGRNGYAAVCDRWRASFFAFADDMGPRPDGHTLDRKDNALGYEKDNCRWATPKQQANNRTTNVAITFNGATRTATEWAREHGLSPITVLGRLSCGWSEEDAITKPPQRKFAGNQWTS